MWYCCQRQLASSSLSSALIVSSFSSSSPGVLFWSMMPLLLMINVSLVNLACNDSFQSDWNWSSSQDCTHSPTALFLFNSSALWFLNCAEISKVLFLKKWWRDCTNVHVINCTLTVELGLKHTLSIWPQNSPSVTLTSLPRLWLMKSTSTSWIFAHHCIEGLHPPQFYETL